MTRKVICRFGAVLISLGLFASACTSGDSDVEDDMVSSRTSLVVAGVQEFSRVYQSIEAMYPMLMRLLGPNEQNELVSDVLESWEIADDALSATLTLRPDLEWSDGTPLTSADVAMTLRHKLDSRVAGRSGQIGGVKGVSEYVAGEADSISGLSTPDELTVVVEFEEPNPAWVSSLANSIWIFVLPEHVLGEVAPQDLEDHEYFQTFPVTSGPYTFVEFVPGQHVEYERNDNWSLGEPGFERLFFRHVSPEVAAAQLETGETQLVTSIDPAEAERIGGIDRVEIQAATGVAPFTIGLTYYEPLLDARVRQAMAHAIDREGICEQALQGFCEVPATNIRQLGPEWAIPTEDVTEYNYDPDRARELLDEAGWDPSTELTFLNFWGPGSKETRAIELALGNMADVGINWTTQNIETTALLERAETDPGSFNGWGVSGADFTVDPKTMEAYTSCDFHFPDGPNVIHYCNEELDQLWAAGNVETDPERRAEIYREAFRILNQEVPEIYLYVADEIVAHDSRLKGVKAHSNLDDKLWNIGEWHWEQ